MFWKILGPLQELLGHSNWATEWALWVTVNFPGHSGNFCHCKYPGSLWKFLGHTSWAILVQHHWHSKLCGRLGNAWFLAFLGHICLDLGYYGMHILCPLTRLTIDIFRWQRLQGINGSSMKEKLNCKYNSWDKLNWQI